MIGPEGAAAAIAGLLEEHLPAMAVRVVERLEVHEPDATRLERAYYVPQRIEPRQLLDLPVDDWPAFLVVARRLARLKPVDVGAAAATASATVFAATYELRVFTYARGLTDELTDLARKRLTLAVRETLLEHLAFRVTVGGAEVAGTIDPLSLVEEYSDIGYDEDLGATIAASQTDLTATLEEVTELAQAAPVAEDSATVEVGAIPHPALD